MCCPGVQDQCGKLMELERRRQGDLQELWSRLEQLERRHHEDLCKKAEEIQGLEARLEELRGLVLGEGPSGRARGGSSGWAAEGLADRRLEEEAAGTLNSRRSGL